MSQERDRTRKSLTASSASGTPSPDGDYLVRIEGLSVGFESSVVLKDVSLGIPRRGVLGVLGPSGVGKSTFLRTLGRWNDPLPSFWTRGNIWLDGQELLRELDVEHVRRRLALLTQKARLYTATILENVIAEMHTERPLRLPQKRELAHQALAPLGLWEEFEPLLNEEVLSLSLGVQRKLSIARLLAGGAVCLLADEPLRDISEDEARDLRVFIERVASELPVIMVTHDQRKARELCDTVCLMTAGRVIEVTPAEEFFTQPKTALARTFLEFGNCWPTDGDDVDNEGGPATWEPPEEQVPRPGGFHWVLAGLLGGTQLPGLLRERDEDLSALANLGCRTLVSLTEEAFDPDLLIPFGITAEHFPIVDMNVPTFADAEELCQRVSMWIDEGAATVFHCKAGLGRTGTMLACTMVYRGENPVRAIEQVRAINPYYIQSRDQLDFVSGFANYLSSLESIEEPGLSESRDNDVSPISKGAAS